MNHLFLFGGIACSLLITLIVYHTIMKIHEHKLNKIDPYEQPHSGRGWITLYKRPRSRGRIIFENLLLICFAGFSMLTASLAMKYNKYGAFYDDSWRIPDVEEHFLFESADSEDLYEVYTNNPDAFDFDTWNVVIIRLGCPTCEAVKDDVDKLQEEGYKVIFSRSPIGKLFVEHYNIDSVPCRIEGGKMYYETPTNVKIEDENGEVIKETTITNEKESSSSSESEE